MSQKVNHQHVDVAFVLPSFRGGGAEISTIRLANQLAKHGYNVDCVALQAVGPFRERILPSVEVHDLRVRRASLSVYAIATYIRTYRPQILVGNMSHINVACVLATLISRLPIKLMLVEHNDYLASILDDGSWKDSPLRIMMRFTYPRATWIAAVSHGAAESLEKVLGLPKSSVHVLPNGIDLRSLKEEMRAPLDHIWFLEQESVPVVTSIGRLVPQKGFLDLLFAFSILRSKMQVRLMIIGEGIHRQLLEQRIKELELSKDVSLMGFVDKPLRYVARSDLYVLSSRYEGQGVVLLEAMACGVPIVATDCPSGPREVLAEGRAGLLVPVNSPQMLAKAMERMLRSSALRAQVRRAASEEVKKFDVEMTLKRFLDIVGCR